MLRKILKSAAVLASGAAIGQLFIVLLSPVLTRLYKPAEFGVFGVYVALLYMLLSFSSLRYEVAIPLAKSDDDARALTALAIIATALFALVLFPIATLFQIFRPSNFGWVFQWFLPVGVAAAGIYNVLTYARLRQNRHSVIARTRLTQLIGGNIVQVIIGFFHAGVIGLVLGQVLGLSLGVSKLARNSSLPPKRLFFDKKRLIAQVAKEKNFAIYDAPSALLSVANNHAPVLLLTTLFSPAAGGMYALAQRVFSAPLGLLSSALSASLISMGRDMRLQEGDAFIRKQFLLTRFVAPLVTAGALLAFKFFGVIFGHQWSEAGAVAAWLALFLGQKFNFEASSSMYAINGRLRDGFVSQVLIFVSRFAVFLGAGLVFSLSIGLAAFSVTSAVAYMYALRQMMSDKKALSGLKWVLCLADAVLPFCLLAVFMLGRRPSRELILGALIYAAWSLARICTASAPLLVRWKARAR